MNGLNIYLNRRAWTWPYIFGIVSSQRGVVAK
jgi:hypothetical protein